jgi:uncharacterized protein YdeI (YjbR/CyaY-like superfamily)
MKINPLVDKYLRDGCMRCKYGGTEMCKVLPWREELELLRQIMLETGLTEEIKWGVPVYTKNGKNIVTVNALKESANLGFYKGVLMKDEHKILQQQGNVQVGRIIRFTNPEIIKDLEEILKSYVYEAIAIEESGIKPEVKKNPEPVPEELNEAFDGDPIFETAFYSLTPGRQRGYIIHFSQPKQSASRRGRIEKYKEQILNGIGLNDKYSG